MYPQRLAHSLTHASQPVLPDRYTAHRYTLFVLGFCSSLVVMSRTYSRMATCICHFKMLSRLRRLLGVFCTSFLGGKGGGGTGVYVARDMSDDANVIVCETGSCFISFRKQFQLLLNNFLYRHYIHFHLFHEGYLGCQGAVLFDKHVHFAHDNENSSSSYAQRN